MKYKVGDRVRIKSIDWYNKNERNGNVYLTGWFNFIKPMADFCGKIVTIKEVQSPYNYHIFEDEGIHFYTDEMIEGLVEEETKPEPKFKVGDEVIAYVEGCVANFSIKDVRWNNELNKFEYKICSSWHDSNVIMQLYKKADIIEAVDENGLPFNEWLSYKGAFYIPDGYELKDENGNVINAQKIVLEKKKKEYPKTYEECLSVLGIYNGLPDVEIYNAKPSECTLFETLIRLKRCRDAYWKLAGEEMGLGKPWEPYWHDDEKKYTIEYYDGEIIKDVSLLENRILVFPTAEMRDAFYENFKEEIESCKELL